MEKQIAELIARLQEIQSGGRERSRKLVAEDARLLGSLRKTGITRDSTPPRRSLKSGPYDAT